MWIFSAPEYCRRLLRRMLLHCDSPLVLRLSARLGPTWRRNFHLDSVWVFTIQGVVAWPTGVRILGLVQRRVAAGLDPGGNFIDMGPGDALEGKVIQTNPLAVIASGEMFSRRWQKAEVGLAFFDIVHAAGPSVVVVAEQLHERCPECYRGLEIADVDFDMVKQGGSPD